jgi:hypothetical protein
MKAKSLSTQACYGSTNSGEYNLFSQVGTGRGPTLSTAFGEDWTRYLQASVFTYNASECRSTGFSPYYLMHGREPALLEEVTIGHTFHKEDKAHDINDVNKRLKDAVNLVRGQQGKVATLNRKAREAKSKDTNYEVNDHVMYWEPSQPKYLAIAS